MRLGLSSGAEELAFSLGLAPDLALGRPTDRLLDLAPGFLLRGGLKERFELEGEFSELLTRRSSDSSPRGFLWG